MTITKLRELGYNKLADKGNRSLIDGFTEDDCILDSISCEDNKDYYDLWALVYSERFEEAKEMFPKLFEETKTVYNKEDLEEGDIIAFNSPDYNRVVYRMLTKDYCDSMSFKTLSNEQVVAVYKLHWEKSQEVKKHSMEELYKIVGYKFEIKE